MSEPTALRCVDCGHVHPVNGHLHTAAECRDALRTRLTAAEQRAGEAERELARVADLVAGHFQDGDTAADTVTVVVAALGHAMAAQQSATPWRDRLTAAESRLAEAEGLLREVHEDDLVYVICSDTECVDCTRRVRITAFLEGRT